MSNEGGGKIERDVEKKNVAYPILSVSGNSTDKLYGVQGFPSSTLIGADGVVIWKGHPGNVPVDLIKEALTRVLYVAPLEGKGFKSINKRLNKSEYGYAMKDVAKGLSKAPEDAELLRAQESLESILQTYMGKASALAESGDIGPAIELYSTIMVQFKGHAAAKEAKTLSKSVAKGPGAKKELAAWKLVKRGDDAQRAGDYHGATKVYKAAVKSHPDAQCTARASAFLDRH